jgi:hypothetical protein
MRDRLEMPQVQVRWREAQVVAIMLGRLLTGTALLLVPLALLIRSPWLRLATAIPLGIFLLLFGGRLVPRPAAVESQAPRLCVATFNNCMVVADLALDI